MTLLLSCQEPGLAVLRVGVIVKTFARFLSELAGRHHTRQRGRRRVGWVKRDELIAGFDVGYDIESDHVHDAEWGVLGLEEHHPESVDVFWRSHPGIDHRQ